MSHAVKEMPWPIQNILYINISTQCGKNIP